MSKDETKQKLSPEEQAVEDHRKLLIISGMLSEFQLENLQKWPFVVFGKDLDKTEISYDFKMDQKDEVNAREIHAGKVEFDLYFKTRPDDEFIGKGLLMMEIWTKFLFWQDTEVIFRVEGKKWDR